LPPGYVVVIWEGMIEPQEALHGSTTPLCYVRNDGSRMWMGSQAITKRFALHP
jgi:hypothetical protein